MTIVASGEISLGVNATTTRSVACELDRSGTSQICMDETAVRTLAARTTAGSAICMNDFYGKTSVPTTLGQNYRGGYYAGTITSPANYYLVLSPNATGCAQCRWKTSTTSSGLTNTTACNENNGYWAVYSAGLNNSFHPAGSFTATRSIGGFTDWYLPSKNEYTPLYNSLSQMPSGQGWLQATHWTSTEFNASCACGFFFGGNYWLNAPKCASFFNASYYRIRAVRRVPV